MKVRWSSTYVMLHRASKLKEFLDEFIYEIGRQEPNLKKRAKIDALKIKEEEWQRQAFSSEGIPTLQTGLPALEALHKAWSSQSTRSKYSHFLPAIEAAAAKIEQYYNKTSTSYAYTFIMILDPDMKLTHFKKYWTSNLLKEVIRTAEEIFQTRYKELYGENRPPKTTNTKGNKKLAKLMEEYSSEDDEENEATQTSIPDSAEPWRQEFDQYLKETDEVPSGMTLPQWWGVRPSVYFILFFIYLFSE
ncbi:hypothetical protein BYT27DRAFT_7076347 [Phlegmacium glaucopus]|nr:hypothetical protein BYT27DRAFT_7111521 [Phlegmacium glaucopus]KAF8816803.1 hypothetical protein BYT27DRAFT_7076347 [Phlegmacium glaucopus]